MASYNKVMLMGNLTRDPEVRYTPKGSAVADLAIAVNRSYTADNGEKREEVTYVDVVLWARLAEIASQYLKKGSPVFIEGRLQMDSWEDKQTGQKRSRLRVVGEIMQMLGGKRDGSGDDQGGGGGGGGGGYQQRPQQQYRSGGGGGGGGAPRGNQPARQSQPANEEYGDGPITDGLEDDDIPF
ncbi:single-strand binding protein [Roseimicrobium gellanilyticum]|uniref:Single-stranded DNA-binding protein n=1 Tax=Roseimicrobium gellanilyticum TaxID=748857 RepID=A0A366HFM3_9BACT|nr:single-stranded DNA-binding protein [Roseimicrobium gellanilyticum]RBP41327.1 single-strand binding protein [Roseimicrobium gellanilyticum]